MSRTSLCGVARWPGLLVAAGVLLGGCGGDDSPPPDAGDAGRGAGTSREAPAAGAAALRAEVDAWHAQRLERLRAPDGWLTLVGLEELPARGAATAGADAGADIVLRADVPDRVGTFTVTADGVRFAAAAGVPVTAGEPPAPVPPSGLPLADDRQGAPTVLRLGPVSWYVIARGERRFVRVKDAGSAVRRDFDGIARWPVDPAWRVTARLRQEGMPPTVPVPSALGGITTEPSPGVLEFQLGDGRTRRLIAMGEADGPLFLVFGDATNGTASYGGGRFLTTEPPAADGTVVLDFNRAVNPPCAFTPHATCPLPPRENVLPVAVTAGEKMWGEPH